MRLTLGSGPEGGDDVVAVGGAGPLGVDDPEVGVVPELPGAGGGESVEAGALVGGAELGAGGDGDEVDGLGATGACWCGADRLGSGRTRK